MPKETLHRWIDAGRQLRQAKNQTVLNITMEHILRQQIVQKLGDENIEPEDLSIQDIAQVTQERASKLASSQDH